MINKSILPKMSPQFFARFDAPSINFKIFFSSPELLHFSISILSSLSTPRVSFNRFQFYLTLCPPSFKQLSWSVSLSAKYNICGLGLEPFLRVEHREASGITSKYYSRPKNPAELICPGHGWRRKRVLDCLQVIKLLPSCESDNILKSVPSPTKSHKKWPQVFNKNSTKKNR